MSRMIGVMDFQESWPIGIYKKGAFSRCNVDDTLASMTKVISSSHHALQSLETRCASFTGVQFHSCLTSITLPVGWRMLCPWYHAEYDHEKRSQSFAIV